MKKTMWKGVKEEEAGNLGSEKFLELATSRARRTMKRLNQNPKLKAFYEKVRKAKASGQKKIIKTHLREAVILPEMVGMKFGVYNGKEFKQVEVTSLMLGLRLGDFSHSTARVLHSGPGVGATRGSKFVPLK